MSDSNVTRAVWLPSSADRSLAINDGTLFEPRTPLGDADFKSLFNTFQREMSRRLAEMTRPGLMTFALSTKRGLSGQLWLEAAQGLRSGTVGRHGQTDLFLPWESLLSLRHLLFLVRRVDISTRVRVLDLKTPWGFRAESGGALRAAEADGLAILSVPGYALVLAPTGEALPWDPDAQDPRSTLPPRNLEPLQTSDAAPAPRKHGTRITGLHGPVESPLAAEALRGGDENAEGALVVQNGKREETLMVGPRALTRGVLLGRYDRCNVHATGVESGLSRVHALLLSYEGTVYLTDAGSTNGTWCEEERIKCAPIQAGRTYRMGEDMRIRWEPIQ